MSKFLPNIKDLSSKFSGSASTQLEPRPDTEVEKEKQDRPRSRRRQLKRSLLQLKRFSTQKMAPVLIKPFTGEKPVYRRPLVWIGLGVGGSAIALAWGWSSVNKSLPKTVAASSMVRDGTLTIQASDGTILQQMGPATRNDLKLEEIPKPLIAAFLAIEDRRFYLHGGVDYQGVLRASASNLLAGNVVQGGSTITQQLARVVYLDQERSVWRKLKEVGMAQKIEHQLTKEQILERYLNLVYLGSDAYGVADAAWIYFSKPLNQLTLPQMAMLAGLPPAPSLYSPFVNEKAALQRRNTVLQEMRNAGYITREEAAAAIATPLNTKQSPPQRLDRQAPYFTDYVQKELPKYVSPKVLQLGGLTVETSLESRWQQAAEKAVKDTVEENGRGEHFSQASLVALDPRNGEIKAMVGGKEFYQHQFNRVTQAKRQPGSTFKPFVYTTAIAAGITPYRGYLDVPFTVDGYTPKNYSETHGGWLSMRDALKNSINVVAVKVLIDVGWQPVIQLAHKMGIESELQPFYSLALGGSEVNLLELTSAYGTFAAQGLHSKAHGIRRILDRNGKVIYQANFQPERALDEETSAIMTWMLRGVVNEGTGRAAQLDRPVAGKTGTSDEARDLWFIGYIPQMVAGVWLGNDNNEPTWGVSSTAASTWHQFMLTVVKGMPAQSFPKLPSNLEGRKPQIKVQPIRPKSIINGKIDPPEKSEDDSSGSRRSRSRRYSN